MIVVDVQEADCRRGRERELTRIEAGSNLRTTVGLHEGMAPDPATGKSRGSRYRTNDAQYRSGDGPERESQRPEMGGKGKADKESLGTEFGRGVKRRQHGSGDGSSLGASSLPASGSHRSSKRWRGDGAEGVDSVGPADRWDGGTSDPVKESASSLGKGKQDLDVKVADAGAGKITLTQGKEGLNMEKVTRKQRVSRASLASDNRAITVMDLQETDLSIIDSNIRIKNKVSYRRESVAEITDSEAEKGVKENSKSTAEVRSRRRWDRDGIKGGAEDVEDGSARGMVASEGSLERDKRKEKSVGRDRDVDGIRVQNGRKPDGTREPVLETGGRPEASDEIDQRTNEWKIQEDLRNVELEKELENRIRRRREESGDRDRWRDDDRERDAKRHSDPREERTREERHREDYSRRERERHSDRHESRQHREGSRPSEGKLRDERHYESDREYRSHREERQHVVRSKDVDDHGRGDRPRDQEHRDRKGRDKVSSYEVERRVREKGYKDDPSDRERSHATTPFGESIDGRSEHRPKRAREGETGEGTLAERETSRQGGRSGDPDTPAANDLTHDDRPRRGRDERDGDIRPERLRASPRDSDSMRGKVKANHWRSEGSASELLREGQPSPRQDTRASPSSNRLDYPSPPRLDDRRSPRYTSQRSPSPPHLDVACGPPRGKTGHGDWFEPSNSVSSSSGTQRRPPGASLHVSDRRDRMKWVSGAEEEVKSGMHRSNRSMDEAREGSLSPHRLRDQHMHGVLVKPPLHGQDTFSRVPMVGRGDRERWRSSTQGGSTSYEGGQLDHHIPEELSPRDRNERGRRMPLNRPPGSPMIRPQLASLPAPPLAPLPPPPPFRPGIDNPAVLGPPNGGFDDGTCSRDQGRGDRKGGPLRREGGGGGIGPGDAWRGVNIGNWNSRNQGPLPGNAFPPFPPQFAPHPSPGGGGFPGMGQQFPGPPIFPGGGGRPPMDMGFGGRFIGPGGHMGENGDGFLGPGRGAGWHGPGEGDDGRGPPLMGPGDGWEGPGPHGDDRHRHGRMEWDRGGPMGVRVWERERERELWEGRVREGASDFMPLRSQMEPPLQSSAFPPGGSGWGMPREPQVLNDLKPRPERPPYDIQESKRKPDGVVPKLKTAKSMGKTQVLNEGKRNKHATAAMQSVLSQLHISPELAGADLYNKYKALLPASDSEKQAHGVEEEDTDSESADDDLNLEVDLEGEALISAPKLLPKLLPPLPEGVFEAAMRVYRKPEWENKLQRSKVGSFILPFDPATVKLPSIKMELRNDFLVASQDQDLAVGTLYSQQQDDINAPVVPQQDVDVIDTETGADLSVASVDEVVDRRGSISALVAHIEHSDNEVAVVEDTQGLMDPLPDLRKHPSANYNDGDVAAVYRVDDSVVAESADRGADAMDGEFLPSYVEVAEYSDREFEADMEDAMEDVQQGVAVGKEIRCQNSEPMEVDESQPTASVADVSRLQNTMCMEVEEAEFENAGVEEILGGNVCAEGEVSLRVTSSGESWDGNNAPSETETVPETGSSVVLGTAGVQQGHAVDAEEARGDGNTSLESEDVQNETLVSVQFTVESKVPSVLEEFQEVEIVEEARSVSNLSPQRGSVQQDDTPTAEASAESDVSLHEEEAVDLAEMNDVSLHEEEADDLAEMNDVANDKELVLQNPEVLLNEAEDTSIEARTSPTEEDATCHADHDDGVYPQTGSLENVNSLVEGNDDAVEYGDHVNADEDADLVEEEKVVGDQERVELEVVLLSEAGIANSVMEEVCDEKLLDETRNELSPEALSSEVVSEAAGDTSVLGESVDTVHTPMVEVVERETEAWIFIDNSNEERPQIEKTVGDAVDDVSLSMAPEDDEVRLPSSSSPDVRQLSDDVQCIDVTEESPSAVVSEPEHRIGSNGKLKEIEEESLSTQEQEEPPVAVVEVQETLPRQLRKRRASSRLLANAEAHAQQEAAQGQASVGVKNRGGSKGSGKRATKGATRTSQRRSKRRGSTR
ncbi:hypothetical protein Mp_7g05580 [Marchantia polymorpha subsp. ruderalis]|uniref:Uncharacterized protein n=2 Tax=Marchantia polymorpha TaxID=3197 RepID=A0AAF6BWG1_MARPO|nr:hypothetical protein MARPO_0057s0112 [Marchantia polymorpha]BBN16345.1 hypothetical protein Mp_7g05580 [Marchantia polymorpha subsp. ruderalis]|eukprot:PTQ37511.1 hypothetical protein MARPO_0057s0112 [Marchantia polymorpha]